MKHFPQQLKGVAIATVFFIGLLYVQAWTGAPVGTPPANNVDAPINVGDAVQYKSGSLGIGTLLKVYGTFNIPAGAGAGKVLTSDAEGNALWIATSSLGISGGGTTPTESLVLNGGTYTYYSTGNGSYSCYSANLITGVCSCPTGYTGKLLLNYYWMAYSCEKIRN